uniref:Large ribosomal subunit protein mL50 n=3 Tax=Rhodnius TaxID=13248 RepID=T1I7I6_RHOPR
MAALIKHVMSKNSPNKLFSKQLCVLHSRQYAKKHFKEKLRKVEMPACRKLQSTQDSVSAKGFLRCQKSYQPPENLENTLKSIVNNILGSTSFQSISHSQKYQVLSTCAEVYNHSVPNSILHQIETYDDLKKFYSTPVDTVLPLERMKRIDLPTNLHVQYEPQRFHPDEDTMFNGQTAFPKSNTLVTGIRTKRKFKGSIVVSPFEAY